jgi:hypothetical protein
LSGQSTTWSGTDQAALGFPALGQFRGLLYVVVLDEPPDQLGMDLTAWCRPGKAVHSTCITDPHLDAEGDGNRILALFRLYPNGRLRRLKRWPPAGADSGRHAAKTPR